MRAARCTALLCVGAVALAAVGCGGNEDQGNEAPADPAADRAALTKLSNQLGKVVARGDAMGFCQAIEPAQLKETFGTVEDCAKALAPSIKSKDNTVPKRFRIVSVEYDGADKAVVTYAGSAGSADFYRTDGNWYTVAPQVSVEPQIAPDSSQ